MGEEEAVRQASPDVTASLLGRPAWGDGTCRGGYGVPVFARFGTRCAYCDRDLGGSYESWLDLSVDHVVPGYLVKARGYPTEWVEDLLNLVTCCRACNEFLNGYRVTDEVPVDLAGFADLIAVVVAAKRERALKRHELERTRYETWRSAPSGTPG